MPNPYGQLLRTPRGPLMSASGFVARLPLSMAGIALLLLVVEKTDSYALGGAVQATWVVVEALVAPLVGRLVDRFGQWQVVAPQVSINIVATAALIAVISLDFPLWTWFVVAGIAGAALPVIGALVRARWGFLLSDSPVVRTAYSWESVVDEMVFVLGPPAATLMAVALGAGAALAITIGVGTAGTAAFLLQRRSQPPVKAHPHDPNQQSALRFAGMPQVFAVMLLLGSVFAGVEVTVIATAREAGQTGAAGVVLALWAAGSLLAGLIVGGLTRPPPLPRQMLFGTAVLTATLVPLLFTDNLIVVGAVLFVAGVGVSPSLIAGFALVNDLVPTPQLTEGLTWVTTGLSLGFAVGSPTAGLVVDTWGPSQGFVVGVASAVAATAVAWWGRRWWALPAGQPAG